MSFNRGVKRNSFGSVRNNFGRSGGGGGGGGIGGGNGGGNTGMTGGQNNRGMNPWESGSMPGRGILPTPNNNLSINSSQAELVIVSNLLNNLIRTQQEPQPQVPSLLSLGTSLSNPLSNFRNQGNFGNNGRFNDRLQRLGNNKNQQQPQRAQPYNKMGNNRARDGVAGRRGPSSAQFRAQSQSGNQRNNGNQNQHRNDKNTKASKKNETSKKEQLDVKKNNEKPITENVVKSDEAEESQDKKRDWKDEKKDVDATVVKKIDDKVTADKNNKKNDDNNGGKKIETRHADSRYSAVPTTQMTCHVCTKRMWDGSSFENHLRGRAHQLMMEKLDESYKLKVDLMRHELRVSEEQREMSLNNSKRRGKKVSVDLNVREYCTMCDLNFYGTLTNHRKSDKHQQLKTFLHPRCVPCSKEFPSRIEYDEHRLTPGHMINTVQTEEQKKTKKQKLAKGESEVCNANDEEKDTQINEVNKTTDKDEEPLTDNTEYLLDIIDDMDMKKYKIPSQKYFKQKQIKIGSSMIKEVQGYHCDKCRKFMLTPDDVSMHLKTVTHYKNFVAEVKLLTTPVEKVEETVDSTTATPIETPTTADESSEIKVDEKDPTTEEPSTVNDDDNNKEDNNQDNDDDDDHDGNFKRRKLDTTTTTTTTENNEDKINDIDDKIDSQMDEIDDIDDDIEDLQNIINNSDENNKIQDTNENDNLINDIINDKINDDVENNGIKESINIQNDSKTNCNDDEEEEGDVSMMSVEAFGDKPKIDNKTTENNDVKVAEVIVEKIDDKIIEKPVSSDNQVLQDKKIVEQSIIAEKIIEKTVVPEKTVEKVIVPEKTVEKIIVPEKTVEKVIVPDKVAEKIPEKIIEKKIVPEKTPIPAKIAEEIKKVIDSMPEAPPAPIISSPINQHHRHSLNNSKNHSPNMHTPNKSPRGGGGFRGNRGNRGTQRARRSRR